MITEFKCRISQSAIDDLRSRLRLTRWTDEILNSEWNYGAKLSYIKELTEYWLNEFDWKKTEDDINSYPNYIAEIDGIKIHFVHIRSKKKNPIPLIITHGWPGSFLEMMKLTSFLTKSSGNFFRYNYSIYSGFWFFPKNK